MTILSTAIENDVKYVLTVGNMASLTGNMKGDMAVYTGSHDQTAQDICRKGLKLTHHQATAAGYEIAEENYRR